MPQELQIIRASEFVRMGAQGYFDLAASKAALAELAGACRKRGIHEAMLDLRALHFGPKPVFSPADLAELVGTFREIGFTHQQRLAILYQSDPYRRARLFAFLSSMHGWSVRAFSDFEKALLWLSQRVPPAPRKRMPGEKEVPVRFLERGAKAPARSASPSRSLKAGRVSPSAPSAIAQTRRARTVSAQRGALGETRPTSARAGRPATGAPQIQTRAASQSRSA